MATQLHILVAEDEPLTAMALQAQLELLGHRVAGPARNGREAVEIARNEPVDIAILDIRMPEMSGLDAAQEMFRIRPLPIILLTGYSDPEYIEQAAGLPVYHYLVKPVAMEDLLPAIGVARSRFEEWSRFKGEAAELEQKIAERKLIEQAKGIIMKSRRLSEEEAYKLLQKESQNRNQPMVEIARTLLLAESLLGQSSGR